MSEDQIIQRALEILSARARSGAALTSPSAVRDYLRLALSGKEREFFLVVFLDAQHRVLGIEELFSGTLTQTSVYPREVVKAALKANAASVIFAHFVPSNKMGKYDGGCIRPQCGFHDFAGINACLRQRPPE